VPQFGWLQAPQFIQNGDEFGVVDAEGRYILLQDSSAEPVMAVSDLYPIPSQNIELVLTPTGDPRRVLIRWNDGIEGDLGRVDDIAWPANQSTLIAVNSYTRSGDADLIATVLYENGTTQTGARTIHVGDEPPTRQTFVQWAFSDQVDNTWGILGIIMAVIGGAYGYWRLQRSRRRLGAYTKRLHDIRQKGHTDPMAALRELQELRAEARDRTMTGALDHTQLQLIEDRAASTARTLMFQAIAPFRGRLSPVYQGMLSGFFEDGRIGDQEAESALQGIDAQAGLTGDDRHRLQALFNLLRATSDG
jgi:hypothetical protein